MQNKISPQFLLQEIALDDLLERIALSPYRDNLILKGGFLIGSLLGLDTRSTMDIDTTLVGLAMTEKTVADVFSKICKIQPLNDQVRLELTKVEPIRDKDQYGGFRVHIRASIFNLAPTIKVDLSTGDRITPRGIKYHHRLITDDRTITVMAYNVETLLAEKLETVIARSITNTRAKDFYDLYALATTESQEINYGILRQAVINTGTYRQSLGRLMHYHETLQQIRHDSVMLAEWRAYQQKFIYAQGISLEETCDVAESLLERLNIN
ncbi:nucleotidyl transferase AbiEii/AbiGii toxin family protein [Schleiferilactobacillus shenzhenensis]|uniref:nucleotidyl transferase AbiEii/AbiGii toxin family protein n=1 Tax=Schleiferilactobacillus shenzhenensis TaxID=1231337 RepID=UPI0018CAE6AA|nr:nucleotidyl transferase AbiEii/AbiGii toxin family protein [Schleiferilactobacillus shenzhenensis]